MSIRQGAVIGALILLGLSGCGEKPPKTYPVSGKVVLVDGDVKDLAGCHVEFRLESDPTLRADGVIGPDGHFELQTRPHGKALKGAVEGKHQARIILSSDDDDDGAPKRRQRPINNRFLDFEKSGLSYEVPTPGDITLPVSRR